MSRVDREAYQWVLAVGKGVAEPGMQPKTAVCNGVGKGIMVSSPD